MVSSSGTRWVKHTNTHRRTHSHALSNTISYSFAPVKTHIHYDKYQLPQSHFLSSSFTSARVQPRTATSCHVFMLLHTCAHTHAYMRLALCVFLYCISIVCVVWCGACTYLWCVYIPSSPRIPSPTHSSPSSSCPISPCGFKGWGVVGLPAALP